MDLQKRTVVAFGQETAALSQFRWKWGLEEIGVGMGRGLLHGPDPTPAHVLNLYSKPHLFCEP